MLYPVGPVDLRSKAVCSKTNSPQAAQAPARLGTSQMRNPRLKDGQLSAFGETNARQPGHLRIKRTPLLGWNGLSHVQAEEVTRVAPDVTGEAFSPYRGPFRTTVGWVLLLAKQPGSIGSGQLAWERKCNALYHRDGQTRAPTVRFDPLGGIRMQLP